jgi:hypothetical protein
MAEDAPFVVAKDEYHLDVGEFYSIAYHCAKAHPDGNGAVNPDIYQHPTDGSKPECFYNNGVIVADFIWEDNGVVHSQNVDINTGGVVENPAAPNYPDQRPPTPE